MTKKSKTNKKRGDSRHQQHDKENDFTSVPPQAKIKSRKEKRKIKQQQDHETMRAPREEGTSTQQFVYSQTATNDNQLENARDIQIPSFNISANGKVLFQDASLMIAHGRKYGLVGRNGKGKSTLLKMLASGDLKTPPGIDMLYVEQEVEADDTPAVNMVLKADKKRWKLVQEEKELFKLLENGEEDPALLERWQQVSGELEQTGAESSQAKACQILHGLGFDSAKQKEPTKKFSGGWRMRISLARALFFEPRLLMLDEPTNHLDLNAVRWLEDYLKHWTNTLLIVSHDQDFLNNVCEEILNIEDSQLVSYKCSYDRFKEAAQIKYEKQVKAYEKQQKRLKALKSSGQSKATATEIVKKDAKREAAGERRIKQKQNAAIATGMASAEQTTLLKQPREYKVKLEFAEAYPESGPLLEVRGVHFRYSPVHPVIFDEVDFGLDMDSRVCIVGPNGAGKSTLLNLLTGTSKPTKGEIWKHRRLRMGIFNQHFVDHLPMNTTPIQHLMNLFGDKEEHLTEQSIHKQLGDYGLERHARDIPMRDLSGGQKARVVFAELSLKRPHLLLLNEPTNNLDIETIDALVDAINAFNGGVVVVTHDQRLIEACECDLWVVEGQGVMKWEAGFEDYKEKLLAEMEDLAEREAQKRKVARSETLARLKMKN